jgi:hypothetical protein
MALPIRWQARVTRLPIPSHISARPQDRASLISGVTAYDERTLSTGMDPVIAAAAIAFGFVYIHYAALVSCAITIATRAYPGRSGAGRTKSGTTAGTFGR